MTVGELKKILENYDESDTVLISYDTGYCYGDINTVENRLVYNFINAIILEE